MKTEFFENFEILWKFGFFFVEILENFEFLFLILKFYEFL
jgi:hypothetical protein